ncbi:phage Gp37/Gp68 family protein [Mesorhizobium sp.]|uniref:DUF5131 family protein n=1 Tax=Mesorhizobium sp. TaxID=1871066 RepID=UPI000FE94186|nr:phage Gp37/Gp68 family protein [Mesorhizobium sp.]RWF02954.1 MAG: phage Gp37/Gp68 family protein [Mesorhizobium sp.]
MADKSAIEWTDATWNPIVGCSILTPGCTHCYAMGMAARIEAMTAVLVEKGQTGAPHYDGTTRKVNGKAVWTGKLAIAPDHILLEPLIWRAPRRIFVNSMGDLFHEDVPDEWIDKVFAVMALAPQHTFQVLTKRAKRMRDYVSTRAGDWMIVLPDAHPPGSLPMTKNDVERHLGRYAKFRYDPPTPTWPLRNVWLGVSAERQIEWDERTEALEHTPAAIRFVSIEPMLGPIDCRFGVHHHPDNVPSPQLGAIVRATRRMLSAEAGIGMLDWIIVGGESGPSARPMHPAWARSIRDQCAAAGVPFFFKQWGAYRPCTTAELKTACGAVLVDRRKECGYYCDDDVGCVDHGGEYILHVGKKAAGRLLDGIEHNAMPEAR